VKEGSGRRVLAEPYHRVRNPRAGSTIWEPSRGMDDGAAGDTGNSQRYCDSARTEPGRRRGCKKNRELATPADLRCEKGKTARTRRASRTEGTTEEKKSGPRQRFSGARRIDDCGELREEQELESGGAVEKHARGGAKP
jgi:hypothetical protein